MDFKEPLEKNAPTTYFFFNTAVNLISEPRNHSKFCTLRPNPAPGRSAPFKTLYCSFIIHFSIKIEIPILEVGQ